MTEISMRWFNAGTAKECPYGPNCEHHLMDDICHPRNHAQEGAASKTLLLASAPELAAALRELHDFAVVDPHYKYESRSKEAFTKAAELLKRVGF